MKKIDAPAWAMATTHPEPGAVEYARSLGSVICCDNGEEIVVILLQRDTATAAQVSLAGLRFSREEADLLSRMIRCAVQLLPGSERSEEIDQ